MLQIALLLCGRNFIRRNLPVLMLAGSLWGFLGALILADGMLGAQYFPLRLFGWLLLSEGLVMLMASSGARGAKRGIYLFRGGAAVAVALLILSGLSGSNLLLAIILGFICFLSGTFVIASAWVVRYPHWRRALAGGTFQIIFAIALFQPYPTHHDGTVPQFIGVLMILSAVSFIRLSRRLRHLAPGQTIFNLQGADRNEIRRGGDLFTHNEPKTDDEPHVLRVLVWTPEGSSGDTPVPRPILNRYIAAVDTSGVISTGHAALEMQDVYISLYPAVDIDRSPSEFFRTLRAVQENDVPGRFQPSYAAESAGWCEADRQVCFHAFSAGSLRAFSQMYRQREVYNLTWRNCSSSVAYALEAALDGVLDNRNGWGMFSRLLFRPELWIAAQLRKRAVTMAWTPGLVLDYARALHGIVHPVRLSWFRKPAEGARSAEESAGER
ncbi:MAG: tripartite tricarboxylate transporter TctB family protein [Pantoea sp.]|uniref:HdeD family acid-resistance protein n=1 Tax=Pantoea sp. TaxID=69393 RepID=UPI0039E518B4